MDLEDLEKVMDTKVGPGGDHGHQDGFRKTRRRSWTPGWLQELMVDTKMAPEEPGADGRSWDSSWWCHGARDRMDMVPLGDIPPASSSRMDNPPRRASRVSSLWGTMFTVVP